MELPQSDVEEVVTDDSEKSPENSSQGIPEIRKILDRHRGAMMAILLACTIGAVGTGCKENETASGGGREGRPIISEELKKSVAAAEKEAARIAAEKETVRLAEKEENTAVVEKKPIDIVDIPFPSTTPPKPKKCSAYGYGGSCYYYVDENNRFEFSSTYFDWASEFSEGLAMVNEKGRFYYINRNGVNAFGDKSFEDIDIFVEGIARVKKNRKYYYIGRDGANSFGNQEFDSATRFQDGLAVVGIWQDYEEPIFYDEVGHYIKWYINIKGEKIFGDNIFEDAHPFNEGMAAVKIMGEWHYINTKGEKVFGDKVFTRAGAFSGGFADVVEGRRPYTIDRTGKQVKRP